MKFCDWVYAGLFEAPCLFQSPPLLHPLPPIPFPLHTFPRSPEQYKAQYGVDEVKYVDELHTWMKAAAPKCINVLHGTNTDRCEQSVGRGGGKV